MLIEYPNNLDIKIFKEKFNKCFGNLIRFTFIYLFIYLFSLIFLIISDSGAHTHCVTKSV